MSEYVWLGVAAVTGVAAYVIGSTALGRYRMRQSQDDNEARYRAWRGRATPSTQAPIRGMTPSERRLVLIGGVFMAVCLASLGVFFAFAR